MGLRTPRKLKSRKTNFPASSSSAYIANRARFSGLNIIRSLIVSLGVTRTHRLHISVPTIVLGPRLPDDSAQTSKMRIGADAVKDVLEHFALSGIGSGKGKARDPQLVWEFGPAKVKVKSVEVGKGIYASLSEQHHNVLRCITTGSDYLSTALDIDARPVACRRRISNYELTVQYFVPLEAAGVFC